MDRRTLLAALGVGVVGLAGCQRHRLRSSDGDDRRRVSLAGQDAVPDAHAVSLDVEVLEGAITPDRTARLRLTVTNEGADRALSAGEGMCNLFNRDRGGSDDPAGLWLYRPAVTEGVERRDDRWVQDRPSSEPRGFPAYACSSRQYASGESVATELEVWDDYRVEGYLEPGTYRWEEDVQIQADPEAAGIETAGATVTWGFSLAVERDD